MGLASPVVLTGLEPRTKLILARALHCYYQIRTYDHSLLITAVFHK